MEDLIQEKVMLAVKTIARSPYAVIPLNTPMSELAVDSIDWISLLFELETALGIDIPNLEDIDEVKTLGDLIERVREVSAGAVAQKTSA